MPRITSTGSISQRYAGYRTSSGFQAIFLNDTLNFTSGTLSRSDVVKNVIDSTGWRKPSPYSATADVAEAGNVDLEMRNGAYTYFNKGMVSPHTGSPTFKLTSTYVESLLPPTSRMDQAVVKARNKVADRVASFGESLAELRESLKGLGTLAEQIDAFLKAALAKDARGATRALGLKPQSRRARRAESRFKKLTSKIPKGSAGLGSNAWLCWNFGLSPIISDMVSLAILMGEGKPLRVTGKHALYEKDSVSLVGYTHALSFGPGTYTTTWRQQLRRGTYVRLDYEVSLPALRNLTSYGLSDAPAVAWALVPYSFLVDFVIPVSEVLRSLTATFGLTYKGGTATRFVTVDQKFLFGSPVTSNGCVWDRFFVSAQDMKGKAMRRSVYVAEPNPLALWLKDPLDAFKVTTVFALLIQRFKVSL